MLLTKPTRGMRLNKAHPLARGFIGCWLFNENTGLTAFDLSGKRIHGTLTNMTQADWVPGRWGIALDFDGGNDYVALGTSNVLSLTGNFTVAARICKSGSTLTDKIYDREAGNSGIAFQTWGTQFQCWLGDGVDWQSVIEIGGAPIGTWLDGAAVYDGILRLYRDGLERDTQAQDAPGATAGIASVIGANTAMGGDYFEGRIEYVYIWNRALDSASIRWLYREPYAMFDYPLTYWPLPVVVGNPWYAYAQQ